MKLWFVIVTVALVLSSSLFAEESTTPIPTTVEPFSTGNIQLSAQASLLNIAELDISNALYRTSYVEPESAAKLVSFQAAQRLFDSSRFVAYAQLNVGFSYLNGSSITSIIDGTSFNDRANLIWIPMQLSLKAQLPIPDFTWVTPTLTVGLGLNYLSQYGHSSAIAASHWIPSFTLSPALLFMGHKKENDWFGGFSFGTTYHSSFGSLDRLRVLSIDLAFHFWL